MRFTDQHYDSLVKQTEQLITQTEKFIEDCRQVLAGFYNTDFHNRLNIVDKTIEEFFERLKWRIKTGLINIAVTGEFSSGKSFFISGLIKRTSWSPKPDPRVTNKFDDEYASLLPASTEQTTSCPLEVRPATDEHSHSWLEVTFEDDPSKWVHITLPPDLEDPEDELHKLLLGYVTTLEGAKFHRRKEHRNSQIVKARLHVVGMEIPAAFHDLPGLGGIDIDGQQKIYRQTFEDAMNAADCILYLTSSEKVLGENELQMLSYIENIWRSKKIPVFFILTKVDKQSDSDVTHIRTINRKYFQKFFSNEPEDTESDFLGEGFIPASAAWEAKALGRFRAQHVDLRISEEVRDSLIKSSGMPKLRDKITDHLKIWAGPTNLRSIVIELGNLLLSAERELSSYLQGEAEPLDDINKALSELQDEHKRLEQFKIKLNEDLAKRVVASKKIAFKDSLNYDLKDKLRTGLRPLIDTLDVLNKSNRHKIAREQDRLIREWLEKPDGLYIQIVEVFRRYREDTRIFLNTSTDSDLRDVILKGRARLILEADSVNIPKRQLENSLELEAASNIIMSGVDILRWVGAGVFGTAGGGTIAVVASALSLAGPALVLLAPMSLGLFVLRSKNTKVKREEARKELIDDIPRVVKQTLEEIKENFEKALIEPYIGEVLALLDESSAENANKIRAYQQRLLGDLKPNVVRTEQLSTLLERYELISKQINLFVRSVAN